MSKPTITAANFLTIAKEAGTRGRSRLNKAVAFLRACGYEPVGFNTLERLKQIEADYVSLISERKAPITADKLIGLLQSDLAVLHRKKQTADNYARLREAEQS